MNQPGEVEREADTVAQPEMSARSVALTIIAAAAVMFVLSWAREVFIPIVLGILISYVLDPVVLSLGKVKLPRVIAAGVAVCLLAGSVGLTLYSLSDDAAAVVAQLPDAAAKLRNSLRRDGQNGAFRQVQRAANALERTANEAAGSNPAPQGVQQVQIVQPAFNAQEYLSWGSASVVAFAGQTVLILFFVFFLLASGDLFKRKLVKIVGPSLEKKKITIHILNEIDHQIALFLLVRVITSVVVGIATWIAFRLVGLEQAGVWGLAAGLFNSIPYFGPVIVAAGTFVIAFLQFGTVSMAMYVSGISLAITSLEGWVLTPWLTSRATRTNEVAVFVGLIFWSFVWGIWGTLLAVPMLVVAKAFCDRVEDLKGIGELLGE